VEALPPLASGLIGLTLVVLGASSTVLGRPVLGLVTIAAGGVVLALFAPRLMRRGGLLTRRFGRTLALLWLLAAALSLLVLPLRRTARARADLAWLRGEVDAYARNVGRAPRSLEELRFRTIERFGAGAPRDPWGQSYRYRPPNELASNGPDGVPSADDLEN
jgi:hypothetical protein